MKQPSRQNHRNRNKSGRRSSGGGGTGAHSANRVYDSSGPEGKVRGTAQQIIDKYTSLARDAQTSGEGVLAENFFQHAEHYQRILTTIQAADAEERERRQAQQQAEQQRRAEQQSRQQQDRGDGDSGQNEARSEDDQDRRRGSSDQEKDASDDGRSGLPPAESTLPDGPELVETPESRRADQREGDVKPARRARVRKPAPTSDEASTSENSHTSFEAGGDSLAADAPAKPKRGRPKKTPPPAQSEEADAPT